ncbi:MAG TPA: ABC transporter permease [Mucilaginibacter sp.]|nr:ABC transporter permease [Mucilaginibacter sp.]
MIKNYFKTAIRNLVRNKSYTFVNITGLVVGIAASLLIFLVLQYEQSFDNFHTKKDRLYRVVRISKNAEGREYRTGVPFPVTRGIRADYPQLENATAIMGDGGVEVKLQDKKGGIVKKFNEDNVFLAEPNFFKMFDFKMAIGRPETALKEINSLVLTKKTATKYFGDWKDAVGKTLNLYRANMKVTGILEDPPVNTDFPLSMVVSYITLEKQVNMNNWVGIDDANYCFVQLPANYSVADFNKKLEAFVTRHMPPDHAGYNLVLEPISEMHYDSRFGNFNGRTFSKDLITALDLIGLFLVVVACVNFINLSTAQAITRAREVGVRKVLGGRRKQLVLQFLGETSLVCFISIILATALAAAMLPLLNGLLETQLSFDFWSNPSVILFLAIVFVAITFLSGFYPAIVLSGFNPILALKSKVIAQSSSGVSLRRALVVLQFAIAQVLVIGTLVVVSQMNYFKNADLGFSKKAIVNISYPGDSLSRTKVPFLESQLRGQAGIKELSFSRGMPVGADFATDLQLETNHTRKADLVVGVKIADTAYFNLYRLQLVAGWVYFPSDTASEFVVNEALLKKLNLGTPREALGKRVRVNGWLRPIVGVVKDFHLNSLRDPIGPLVMMPFKNGYSSVNIQLQSANIKQAMAMLEKIWNKDFPDYVFQYAFVDQSVADYYKQENRLSALYTVFSGIAIFISCLGLYGLIAFMAVRRNKEIGIRKVLGASVGHIVYLLSREFTVLIAIAFVVASPVGYYFMHKWLQQYTFRIDLGVWYFVLTIALSLLIAWLAVGYSAVKAATANPVKSLRTE